MAETVSPLQSALTSRIDRPPVGELMLRSGLKEQKHTRRAVRLALPSVLENMGNLSRSPDGAVYLRDTLARTGGSVDQSDDCAELAKHLYGGRLPRAAEQLVHRGGISHKAAVASLEALSGWVLTTLGSFVDDPNDPDAFTRVLADHGGRRTTETPAPLAENEENFWDEPDAMQSPGSDNSISQISQMPPAAQEPVRQREVVATEPLANVVAADVAAATGGGISTKALAGALAALLLVGAAAVMFLSGGGDDSVADTAPVTSEQPTEPQAQDNPPDALALADEDDEASEPAEQSDQSATQSEPAAATTVEDEPVAAPAAPAAQNSDPSITAIAVPLRDIRDVEPDAEGLLDFTFNKVTGEICFEVGSLGVTPPYAAHIHAGDFGVKGGVVADLGQLEPDTGGCISNLPADTLAILAEPSRHYAELHDAGGEWTVRGQLSETVQRPGIVPFTIPMRDILGTSPNSSGVLNFDFNTFTGEVCYSVNAVGVTPPFAGHIHAGGFGIKGGVVLDLGALETGNQGCVQNDLNDTLAIMADPSGHYAELHDAGGEWTVRGQLTETVDNPGVVSLAVPMVDIKNVEPSAEGTLAFDFNTVTGEICYDVTAVNITAPFDAHIHAGDYGVKGGVVVDLGGLEDGSGGCVNNEPNDTIAILADPSGHYAELHDAAGEWTIRGQLSEASAPIDPNATNLLIDTDGGGATLRLERGTIYLDGAVSEQAVADEMVAALAGVSTPVVNNLTVVAGSPLPSGRVVIGDNVFFDTGSDRIKDLDFGTITALVELADSRPDWVMTIVGHTDNVGGDVYNLELSLRRAQALRNVLVSQGMNGDNMRIRGSGETAPIGDNSTEAGRAENRRIEFEFTPA